MNDDVKVVEARKAFLLRMDPALRKELEAWAADELRSINGQIEYLLRQAVLRRKRMLNEESGGLPSGPASTQ